MGPSSNGVSSAAEAQHRAILPISATGKYSYFAVGKECCGCPSTTSFACGDYGYNSGQGGLRALIKEDRAGYTLAAQQWAATNKADIGQPLFFEWVSNPFRSINALRRNFENWFALGNVFAVTLFVVLSVFAKLLKIA